MEMINLIVFAGILFILIIIIIYLISLNKKYNKKIEYLKTRINDYKIQLDNVNLENPKDKDIDLIDKITREFFKEKLDIDFTVTYDELIKRFTKDKKPNYSLLSKMISDLKYSEKNISRVKLKEAKNLLQKIIDEWSID